VRAWRDTTPTTEGAAVTITEAFTLGNWVFGDLLRGD
jgi:hypothetical protein